MTTNVIDILKQMFGIAEFIFFTSFELSKFSGFLPHAAHDPPLTPALTKNQLLLEVVVMAVSSPPSIRLGVTLTLHQDHDHQKDDQDTDQPQHVIIGLHLSCCRKSLFAL